MSFFKDLALTGGVSSMLVGSLSGATANITTLVPEAALDLDDLFADYSGLNATIQANTRTGTGTATVLKVIESGLGFEDNEEVFFTSTTNAQALGTAIVRLGHQGYGAGHWNVTGGELSGQKRLLDSRYWQDLSYDVRSDLAFASYEDLLRKLLHVSGMQPFGSVFRRTLANTHSIILGSALSTISIPQVNAAASGTALTLAAGTVTTLKGPRITGVAAAAGMGAAKAKVLKTPVAAGVTTAVGSMRRVVLPGGTAITVGTGTIRTKTTPVTLGVQVVLTAEHAFVRTG